MEFTNSIAHIISCKTLLHVYNAQISWNLYLQTSQLLARDHKQQTTNYDNNKHSHDFTK